MKDSEHIGNDQGADPSGIGDLFIDEDRPSGGTDELKRRASKIFTNPKDALVAFKELKELMGK